MIVRLTQFNAGRINADELLAAAADDSDPHLSALKVGEAHFHIAHRVLAEGKREIAAEEFKLMEDLNCYYFYEYRWAWAFRERIESNPSWPASIRLP